MNYGIKIPPLFYSPSHCTSYLKKHMGGGGRMVHRKRSLSDVRGIRLSIWTRGSTYYFYKAPQKGGGRVIHRYPYRGGNGGNIQAMGTSNYFILRQFALLAVLDHFILETKHMPCPHEYIFLEGLWTRFYILHKVHMNYEIQIPPLFYSHRHFPTCLQNQRGGWNEDLHYHGTNTNEGGGGGIE